MAVRNRTVEPKKGHRFVPGQEDIAPRLEEVAPSRAPADRLQDPCPEGTAELVPWLRAQFPESSPRTSDPRVIDACIARAGVIDLIDHIEASLLAARAEQKDA